MSERETFPSFQRFLVLLQFFLKLRRSLDPALFFITLHDHFHEIPRLHSCAFAQSFVDWHHVAATHRHQRRPKWKSIDRSTDWHTASRAKSLFDIDRRSYRRHDASFLALNLQREFKLLLSHRGLHCERW